MISFISCGGDAWVERRVDAPDHFRIRATYCRDRWCKPCQSERSRHIAAVLLELIEPRATRMITLTLRHRDNGLKTQLDWLYRCFARLRRSKLWKTTQRGGAAFLECTWNPATETWHPHLHVLAVGSYIPQQALSKKWLSITGDSNVVDVRWIRTPTHAARYVTKYVTKNVSATVFRTPRALEEAIVAMKGRRAALTFGSWRGVPLRRTEPDGEWERVESLSEFFARLDRGDEDAIACWPQFATNGRAVWPYDHPP
ncbi:MAG TPA: protein rep [Acidobacteriota bacterium]|nr:protein rep [Acidobacteriota bacterium]